MFVVTENNTLSLYKIADRRKLYGIKFEEQIRHCRIDYSKKHMLVSVKEKFYVIEQGKITEKYEPKISAFEYIFPLYGYYFIIGKNGTLYYS